MAPTGIFFGVLFLMVASVMTYSRNRLHPSCYNEIEDWDYGPTKGPNTWAKKYRSCGSVMQSPVALPSVWENQSFLRRFNWENYELNRTMLLQNNGHFLSLRSSKSDGVAVPINKGSLFHPDTTFEFEAVEFHWGSDNMAGSEHSQAGITYPGEVHVITFDQKYGSYEQASRVPGGVAIAVFFIQVQKEKNPKWEFLLHSLHAVNGTNQPVELNNQNFIFLYPLATAIHECEYFLYEGSLTSPPCTEGVVWHIYTDPTAISERQMQHLRYLVDCRGEGLKDNNRPVQPLNNRKVWQHRESAKPAGQTSAHPVQTVPGFEYVQPYLGNVPQAKGNGGYGR